MRKYVDGKYLDFSPDELKEMERHNAIRKSNDKYSPMSAEEVSRLLIEHQVNSLSVDNATALKMKPFYPTFESTVGKKVQKGFKFTHNDKLWSVVQPELTIQAHYPPGVGMESLYEEICEEYEGTADEPIPYNGNMTLVKGKHYVQSDKIYLCNRDTEIPVYNILSELVGLYVEEV